MREQAQAQAQVPDLSTLMAMIADLQKTISLLNAKLAKY